MARPREFDRDEALAMARDAFWATGYEGTSISDLVRILGLAPARLYAAFGSKEDLFREAVALYEATEGGFAKRALEEEPTAHAAVVRLLDDAIEMYTRPGKPRGCLVVSAATAIALENDAVRQFLSERRRAQEVAIRERLRRASGDGELPKKVDPDVLASAISALLIGISVQARDGASKTKLLAMRTFATSLYFAAD